MTGQGDTGENRLTVVRGPLDSLSLYEVTDYKLEILERGSPSSILLNFGIFAISVGISFVTAICTVPIESIRTYLTFLVLSIIGIFSGVILLALWFKSRSNTRTICEKIRLRIPATALVPMNRDAESDDSSEQVGTSK